MTLVSGAAWRKSRRCESAACVEVASTPAAVGVRNSTRPQTSVVVSAEAFRAFIAGVKQGEFDLR
ncbi:hypothetical protein Cs7R123_28740 [Catellatospora sp. TT07R-123]|uniref:DUF397 domain-containing protein n=1 Tax=Catellatospora sp. TT07R-123 TaxID=2733863 RepID=UPI001B2F1AB5|nr:DUF397 domain-containing protein [Catellatospora sp. TT07R-123]GHJ45532.1 hypothetical protein Cs7R123_28740 [Catellatospora sp. TT07R-123]